MEINKIYCESNLETMAIIKISSKEKIILAGLLEPLIDQCDFIIGMQTVDYESKQNAKNNKHKYLTLLKKIKNEPA